ncbi:MAG: hypothetical protein A2078_09280 [Nitrospirae bacterium GWC2_57_9]|nr:MAG: hypothetical protein A2078_09280 [Nitrospirae bacterium GWC2_57_9]
MLESEEKRIEKALRGAPEEIALAVHDPSPLVLKALLANGNMTEEDVLIIANRKNVLPDVLEAIARDKRWSDSYSIKLTLARNPRSPLTISLSLARFLRIFDLEEITRNHYIPLVFRHKVEAMIIERVPTMPLGNKKALAKKAAGAILLKLLMDRIPEVVRICLDNPHMIEAHLYKAINRPDTMMETILMIAGHRAWSNRPLIRFALVRNPHTPLSRSVQFLRNMKLVDLRELYTDPSLPITVKPFVHREMLERGSDPEKIVVPELYEIPENEMEEMMSAEQSVTKQEREESAEELEGNDDDGPAQGKADPDVSRPDEPDGKG